MPLPGRHQTFALETCRDLLMKLEREIERYQCLDKTRIEEMTDLAFNISVTAWTLCDWLFGDLTPEQRESLKLRRLADLQDRARSCRALHLCRQVATASKHWEVTHHRDPDVDIIVMAEPSGEWRIYFQDRGVRRESVPIFEEALQFWTELIYPNEIAKGP
jgi:hypothetical protein